MKTKLVKIFSVFFVAIMLFSTLQSGIMSISADTIKSGKTGDCNWLLDGTVLTISGKGDMSDYDLYRTPWQTSVKKVVIENGVTSIGMFAFANCTALNQVDIPPSVQKIGIGAFGNCTALKNVNIPNSVEIIESSAFQGCVSLASINIPSSVTSIGFQTFAGCTSLVEVLLPKGLTYIGERAFQSCSSLTDIFFSNSIKTIEKYAFYNCTSLKKISLPKSLSKIGIDAIDNTCIIYCYKNSVLSNWIANNNHKYFVYLDGSDAECVFGGKFENVTWSLDKRTGLLKIDGSGNMGDFFAKDIPWQKYSKYITSLDLSNELTTIGEEAFEYCDRIKSVVIPNSVSIIEYEAFSCCDSLESVTVYNPVCVFSSQCGLNSDQTIYGFKGSTAEVYANQIGAKFIDVETVHTHTYSNKCDKWCNVCGKTRTVAAHKYSDSCDTTCNICKATRTITHSYKTTTTKATLTKNGSIVKKCTVCGKVASPTTIKYAKTFKLSATAYTYNGKVKIPNVTVKDSAGKTLKKNTDYKVTYASGRKKVGTYKIIVKMIGKYSGTKTLTFKINPVKTTVSKLTAGKKSIKVAITKKSTQVTGYQIQYSTSKKFTNAKTKTIPSYKTTKYTLKSLRAKKIYYVRVRTYKNVGKNKYYSGWSNYKYVKTK